MGEQPEFLEDDTDSPPQGRQLLARSRRDVAAEQRDQPTRRFHRQIHQAEQRRLAGAAGTEQKMIGRRRQRKCDILQHFGAEPVPEADILKPNHAVATVENHFTLSQRWRKNGMRDVSSSRIRNNVRDLRWVFRTHITTERGNFRPSNDYYLPGMQDPIRD